jgi:predicted metal-dependent phosphoesterase TrpH
MPLIDGLALAADAAIDLQMHTTFSDGEWAPEELIEYLQREGFALAAITDHEGVAAAATLQRVAQAKGFPLLVAAELTAAWRGQPTDMLSFGFDPAHPALRAVAEDITRRQCENTRQVWEYVRAQGRSMPAESELERILAQPGAKQPHSLFAAVVGIMGGDEAADRAMTDGGFVLANADIAEVVAATHQSGGVCLIAHPGRGGEYLIYTPSLLDDLRAEVPIDGFEVYYPLHTAEQMVMLAEYAAAHGLLTSAGSDSHSAQKPPNRYRAEQARALLERLGVRVA